MAGIGAARSMVADRLAHGRTVAAFDGGNWHTVAADRRGTFAAFDVAG